MWYNGSLVCIFMIIHCLIFMNSFFIKIIFHHGNKKVFMPEQTNIMFVDLRITTLQLKIVHDLSHGQH
jgi:hypothetical protein